MAYNQKPGRDKINSFSTFQAKGLVNSPITSKDDDDPARTPGQIKRTAAFEKVKKALTPDFTSLGAGLSRKVTQMKPGPMRNLALGVSKGLMGHKSNPSDQQLVSNRVANKEKKQNQTDYPGGDSKSTAKKGIDKRKALAYGTLVTVMNLPRVVKKIADAKKGKIPD